MAEQAEVRRVRARQAEQREEPHHVAADADRESPLRLKWYGCLMLKCCEVWG